MRHSRRRTIVVRRSNRFGTIRLRVRREIHRRPGAKANGVLHGLGRRELAVPDGGQSARQEQRPQLHGHRSLGGGHRDNNRQVEKRKNGVDEAVRGQRQFPGGGHRYDKRLLRRHGCAVQRPVVDRVERLGRQAGSGGRGRHRGIRQGQRASDGRRRSRRDVDRPGRLASGRSGLAGHVHEPRVRFLQARPVVRVSGGGRQAVGRLLPERPGSVLRVLSEQVQRRRRRPEPVRFVRVPRAVLQTGAQIPGPAVHERFRQLRRGERREP